MGRKYSKKNLLNWWHLKIKKWCFLYGIDPVSLSHYLSSIPLSFVHVNDPSSAGLVFGVFPHRFDTTFEEGVITSGHKSGNALDVVVHGPKVFDSVEGHNLEDRNKNC